MKLLLCLDMVLQEISMPLRKSNLQKLERETNTSLQSLYFREEQYCQINIIISVYFKGLLHFAEDVNNVSRTVIIQEVGWSSPNSILHERSATYIKKIYCMCSNVPVRIYYSARHWLNVCKKYLFFTQCLHKLHHARRRVESSSQKCKIRKIETLDTA